MEIDGSLEGVALYRQTVPPRIHQFKIGIQALPITSVNAVKRSARGRQCLTPQAKRGGAKHFQLLVKPLDSALTCTPGAFSFSASCSYSARTARVSARMPSLAP